MSNTDDELDRFERQFRVNVSNMDNNHLKNRIAWCERQKFDTWAVHGDEPKYGAGGFMDSEMHRINDLIDSHIQIMDTQLKERNNGNRTRLSRPGSYTTG